MDIGAEIAAHENAVKAAIPAGDTNPLRDFHIYMFNLPERTLYCQIHPGFHIQCDEFDMKDYIKSRKGK